MKAVAKVLALLAVLGFVSAAFAAEATESKPDKVQGRVKSVDGAKITVTTGRGDNAKETVVTTNDKTTVKVGDKEGKVSDIKANMRLQAEIKDGVATTVTATEGRGRGGATTRAAE